MQYAHQKLALFMSNLATNVTESDAYEIFCNLPIATIRIERDVVSRKSKGFGYVCFMSTENGDQITFRLTNRKAQEALEKYNRRLIKGVPVHLSWCVPERSISIPPPNPLYLDSLANICTATILSNISQTNVSQILRKLPQELRPKIIERLSFVLIAQVYHTQTEPIVSSTQFGVALRFDEICCRGEIRRCVQFNKQLIYDTVFSVYDNLSAFNRKGRDMDENELPKLFDRTISVEFPVTATIEEFKERFGVFTDSILEGINWENVLCTGGSVIASLLNQSELNITKCSTDESWRDSDIDLFLWGMSEPAIKSKALELYNVITDNLTKKQQKFLVCTSERVITIITEHPFRNIQIVNQQTTFIEEALCSFDVDCCCIGFDGYRVLTLARGIRALTGKYNLIDSFFDSPTYCYRLRKYAKRGFSIAYDPTGQLGKYDESILLGITQSNELGNINTPSSCYSFTLPKTSLERVVEVNKLFSEKSVSPYTIRDTLEECELKKFSSASRPMAWFSKFPTTVHEPIHK